MSGELADIVNVRRAAPVSRETPPGLDLADQLGVLRKAVLRAALPKGFTTKVTRDADNRATIEIVDAVTGRSAVLISAEDWS